MKWINVKDKLPDTIGDYLVYDKGTFPVVGWAFFNSNKQWAGSHAFYRHVTHWRQLPKPPED